MYSKILVGLGISGSSQSSYVTKVEIIDLASNTSVCPTLPTFPTKLKTPFGGLGYQNEPIICGGLDNYGNYQRTCRTLTGGTWKNAQYNLNQYRGYGSFAFNPDNHGDGRILVSGTGDGDYQVIK